MLSIFLSEYYVFWLLFLFVILDIINVFVEIGMKCMIWKYFLKVCILWDLGMLDLYW